MWPFTKRLDTPKSQATATTIDATDAITAGLLSRVQARQPIASDVAAVMACRGVWERCGHAMRVEGDLAPQLQYWLPWAMKCLATSGDCFFRLTPSNRLLPSLLATVQGGVDPRSWRYTLTDAAPTEPKTYTVEARNVLHLRIGIEPLTPWRGRSPLARLTSAAAAEFEQALGEQRPAYSVSLDTPLDADDVRQFREQIRRLQSDRLPILLGDDARVAALPSVGDTAIAARRDVAATIAQSFGLGAAFFAENVQGVASREAWRQFINGTLSPIARMIEMEATAKTGVQTRIDVTPLRLVDLVSAAKAYASFVAAGMSEDEALERAGLANE